jgi:hypothetical protein
MSDFTTQLAAVCSLLNQEGARYVVMGARALQLWGSVRATRDIALLIEPTVPNAGRVLGALRQSGLGLAREWLADAVASRAVTVLGASPRVDILTAAGSVRYEEAAAEARTFEIEGVAIPVASIDHLIAAEPTREVSGKR